jgi:hypothetical protein
MVWCLLEKATRVQEARESSEAAVKQKSPEKDASPEKADPYDTLVQEINQKENQYSLEVLTNLKKDNMLSYYIRKYAIDKENIHKYPHFLGWLKNSDILGSETADEDQNYTSGRNYLESGELLQNLIEDLSTIDINNGLLSTSVLNAKFREGVLKDRVEMMKTNSESLVSRLARAKEALERQQVRMLLQEKKQNDLKLKIRFFEQKTTKISEDNLKKAALLIELEKKKLLIYKQYQKDITFDEELNKKLTVSVPPWES